MNSPVPDAYHVQDFSMRTLETELNALLHDRGWVVVEVLGQISGMVKILFAEWGDYRIVPHE